MAKEACGNDREAQPKPREELGLLLPIVEYLDDVIETPVSVDARIHSFNQAYRDLILFDDRFRMSVSFMIEIREARGRETPPAYAVNLSLRAIQHMSRLANLNEYAELSQTPDGWKQLIDRILSDPENKLDELENYLTTYEVATNVPDRYKGPQLWLSLYRERFKKPIRLLDVGPSAGAGVKGLIGGQINHDVRAMQVVTDRGGKNPRIEEKKSVTDYINLNLAAPLEFGECVGVDVIDFSDKLGREHMSSMLGSRRWVKSCFYPSELIEDRKGVIKKFDDLNDLSLENYSQEVADFTDKQQLKEVLGDRKFDVITILTMLHQHTEEERVQIIENAKEYLAPGGVIIIQDFARPDPSKPSGLYFFEKWDAYTNRTMIIDPSSGADEPQDFLWWSDGRCTDVVIAPTAMEYSSEISFS